MSSTTSPWDAASEDIIDIVVYHLKRTRRWSRDARSLRALNTHWFAVLNRHVVEVKPHKSRQLNVDDIRSLPKFQNLMVLDTVLFEGQESEAKDRCRILAESLCHLPHLAELHVNCLLDDLPEDKDQFLDGITSLHFRGIQPISHQLPKIGRSRIQRLVGKFITSDLIDFLERTSSLKTLVIESELNELEKHFNALVSNTARLDDLSLSIQWCCMRLDITKLQNLTTLRLYGDPGGRSLAPLLDLPKLTSLTCTCNDDQTVETSALHVLVKRLESLKLLRFSRCHVNENLDLSTLKHLTLFSFVLDKAILEYLGKRSSLSLSLLGCTFESDVAHCGDLPAVKELFLNEHAQTDGRMKVHLTSMEHLERLKLYLQHTPLDAELFDQIHSLTNLTSLAIYPDMDRVQCPFPFEASERLKDLPNLSCLCMMMPTPLQLLEEFMELEILDKLEELTIYSATSFDRSFMEIHAEALRSRAPHLKFEYKLLPLLLAFS